MLVLLLVGCAPDAPVAADPPTWNADVAPLVADRCVACHTAGGLAPFALDAYDAAAPMAAAMVDAVESGRMPPWGAESTAECEPRFGWKDDPRLSADEKALLRAWADGGALEGDAGTAAEIPVPPSLDLEGVTQEVLPLTPFSASGSTDQFKCFAIDPGIEADRWMTGAQVIAGNAAVVHHVLVFSDPEQESDALAAADGTYDCFGGVGIDGGALLAAWAPGAFPFELPEGTGIKVPAGSRIVMQVHYHPLGATAEPDATMIQFRWTDTEPARGATLALIGNASSAGDGLLAGPNDPAGVAFGIPAGVSDHTEEMRFTIPRRDGPYSVFAAGTHMHYIGVDMRVEVEHAEPVGDEPATECLVQTPRWDFNWQRAYQYDAPLAEVPEVRGGDSLKLYCRYDNTLDNPGVRQALADAGLTEPRDVQLGETTLDEMCLGVFGIVF